MGELRDYQSTAIERLRSSLASGRKRPVLMAPTGAGKTKIASEIISLARSKQKRVAFCVPSLSLIDQTIQAFWREGIRDMGVIQANHEMTDWSRPVQVCSIQTIERRGYPECDMVIVDECHKQFKALSSWLHCEQSKKIPFIGLSATPFAKGMANDWDDLIIVSTTQELIDQGHLSPFRVFAPAHPDLSGVKISAGEYQLDQLSSVMAKKELVADVVETWMRLGDGRLTFVFAVDRAHAQTLQKQFQDSGVACGYQDANTTRQEREALKRQLVAKELSVIANCETLIMGVDVPEVSCIVVARPTRSAMLHVQMIGRGLRVSPGKSDALILDHSDNHSRLGFVTDIGISELDDGKKKSKDEEAKRKAPEPRECPKCHCLMNRGAASCASCGFEFPKKSLAGTSRVTTIDGQLGELRATIKGGKRVSEKHIVLQGKQIPLGEFFGELKMWARMHGHKPGWASYKYREAVGVWPNHWRNEPEMPVSGPVSSWIKSRNIRYAKSARGNHQ